MITNKLKKEWKDPKKHFSVFISIFLLLSIKAYSEIDKNTYLDTDLINVSFEEKNALEQENSLTQSDISNDSFIKNLKKNVLNYNAYNPVEKIYLQTDKDIFTNIEDIWISAYVTLGTELHYSLASKVLYLNLISSNGRIVLSKTIPLNNGRGAGNITIPQNLEQGKYQLRAYTNWMRNFDSDFFFTKTIDVINSKQNTYPISKNNQDIDLQFFPEGGSSIVNLNGRIAFKAIGINGLGKEISGKITDSNNKEILTFKTKYQGAGYFNLKPKEGEKYSAILNNGLTFPLPKASSSGYTILVNNIKKKHIRIKIQASKKLKSKRFYVVGHIRNKKYYQGKFEFGDKPIVDFEIPKIKLPNGIMTLTIFSQEGVPMTERIVFINNHKKLKIKAQIAKKLPNNSVEVEINVTDKRGRPAVTELSVSITDADKYSKDKNKSNIISQLLFESDIEGHIEKPALFINQNNTLTKLKQELIMLTHGWRKLNWKKIKTERISTQKKIPFEKGLLLNGTAKVRRKVLKNKTLQMVALSKGKHLAYATRTNDKGEFSFNDFNSIGNTELTFNTTNKSGKFVEVSAKLNPIKTKTIPTTNFKYVNVKTEKELDNAISNIINIKNDLIKNQLAFNRDDNLLDEVKLKSTKKKFRRNTSSFDKNNKDNYHTTPDLVINPKKRNGETLLDLLEGIPNVRVQDGNVYIRMNKGHVLWVVDGLKHFGYRAPKVVIANIEKIELLKSGVSTAVYGPNGANGVIFIKTKKAKKEANYILAPLKITGHKDNKEFYVPKYNSVQKYYKTTLYWNPMIRTNKDGKATFIITNYNQFKNTQMVIEGLSINGIPGVLLETLKNN